MYFGGSLVGKSTSVGDSPERIVIDNPRPGTYYVVVAGVTVAADGVTFDYHEEMFSKGQGTVAPISGKTHRLSAGQSMPVEGARTEAQLAKTRHAVRWKKGT